MRTFDNSDDTVNQGYGMSNNEGASMFNNEGV